MFERLVHPNELSFIQITNAGYRAPGIIGDVTLHSHHNPGGGVQIEGRSLLTPPQFMPLLVKTGNVEEMSPRWSIVSNPASSSHSERLFPGCTIVPFMAVLQASMQGMVLFADLCPETKQSSELLDLPYTEPH